MGRSSLFLLLMLNWRDPSLFAQAQCSVCRGGEEITKPTRRLEIPGLPIPDCMSLVNAAAVIQPDTDICTTIQSFGTYCGCPISPNACFLCGSEDNGGVQNPALILEGYPASDFVVGVPPQVNLRCETVEALLHSMDESSPICLKMQNEVSGLCGCNNGTFALPPESNNNTTANPGNTTTTTMMQSNETDKNIISGGSNFGTMTPCHICRGGEPISMPDRELDLGPIPVNNCADLQSFTALLDGNGLECQAVQSVGALCGCPIPDEGVCHLCPRGERVPLPHATVTWLKDVVGNNLPQSFQVLANSLSCETLEAVAMIPPKELGGSNPDFLCFTLQLKSGVCGCAPGAKAMIIAWGFRITGFLSLIGSSLIIYDVIRKIGKKATESRQSPNTYLGIMLGMSCFDCISSLAYILGGIMGPRDHGFYQSFGNATTCKIQGFFTQLGFSSLFYNFTLSFYFLLVICFGFTENHFKKIRVKVHIGVVVLGIALALGAIPFYESLGPVCYVTQPPSQPSWLPLIFFFYVPVSIVLVSVTCIMIATYRAVRNQLKASEKYSMSSETISGRNGGGGSKSRDLSTRVFWQNVYYTLSFYIVWPYLFFAYNAHRTKFGGFWTIFFYSVLAPSQGLLNCLVYFQRGLQRRKKRTAQQETCLSRAKRLLGVGSGNTKRDSLGKDGRLGRKTTFMTDQTETNRSLQFAKKTGTIDNSNRNYKSKDVGDYDHNHLQVDNQMGEFDE